MAEPQQLLGGASMAGRYTAPMPAASRVLTITPPDPMLRRVLNLVLDWPATLDREPRAPARAPAAASSLTIAACVGYCRE